MKIGFWLDSLNERGTTVAIFDYARFNIEILGNESVVFFNSRSVDNQPKIVKEFERHFRTIGVDCFSEVDDWAKFLSIDKMHILKAGRRDELQMKTIPSLIHCVFMADEPHGDVYASISSDVAFYTENIPVVPHVVNFPVLTTKSMRVELGIPSDSLVFGGYGGRDQFDIPFVRDLVFEYARNNPNVYFIFANFTKFSDYLPNIIHLPCLIGKREKQRFINTCDSMLWARRNGETFGLAIAEFSSMNKPVIAMKKGLLAHWSILRDKGLWYQDSQSLQYIFNNFRDIASQNVDRNAYTQFAPEIVMKKFEAVFLK